jgi:hypothetical protein
MKHPWDAIAWWEIRRIPFNLLILVVGLVSAFITALVGSHVFGPDQDIGSPFIQVALYAVAANVCYTLGWITEVLWAWGNTAQTEPTRPKVFRFGLIFSIGLTLMPAIVISLIWVVHRLR